MQQDAKVQYFFVELASAYFKCIPYEHFDEEEAVSELTQSVDEVLEFSCML
jgi:hypothetical protein